MSQITFSPDGDLFAAGGLGGGAVFYTQDGSPFGLEFEGRNGVNDIAFSPSGRHLLVAGMSLRVNLFDVEAKRLLVTTLAEKAIPWQVAIDPSGTLFAVGYFANVQGRYQAKVFDLVSGIQLGVPFDLPREVMALQFSPDGNRLVLGSADGTTAVWDVSPDARSLPDITAGLRASLGQAIDLETGAITALKSHSIKHSHSADGS